MGGQVDVVDLERHLPGRDRGSELGALRGADHDAVLVDDVVDGEDVGLVAVVHCEPADLLRPQASPALFGGELGECVGIGFSHGRPPEG